ncbi:hypothetical protein THAOC_12742, partial [Thalassiosira oceanica]
HRRRGTVEESVADDGRSLRRFQLRHKESGSGSAESQARRLDSEKPERRTDDDKVERPGRVCRVERPGRVATAGIATQAAVLPFGRTIHRLTPSLRIKKSQAFYLTMSCVPVANDGDEACANERPEGDFCPICTLPIPIPMGDHSGINVCCMKRICYGCHVAARKRGMDNCPFCRTAHPNNDTDALAMVQARVEKKDPAAINYLGEQYAQGLLGVGLQKDMQKAIDLYTEAADLGSIKAVYNLGVLYDNGVGVGQDEAKAAEFYKRAAMQGHVESSNNLGCFEGDKGNFDNAVRHFVIAAKMGFGQSFGAVKGMFEAGLATEEQYVQALTGYQNAIEAMKSPEREEAKSFHDSLENIKKMFKGGLATKEHYAEALKGYQDTVEEMKSHDRDEAKRLRDRQ